MEEEQKKEVELPAIEVSSYIDDKSSKKHFNNKDIFLTFIAILILGTSVYSLIDYLNYANDFPVLPFNDTANQTIDNPTGPVNDTNLTNDTWQQPPRGSTSSSSSSSGSSGGGERRCSSKSCNDLGFSCGKHLDNCGIAIYCGICLRNWVVLNQGFPVDDGEPVVGGAEVTDSVIDNQGNLVYFLRTQLSENIIGRFNVQNKKWELFTENGWSSEKNAIPWPISQSHLRFYSLNSYISPNKQDDLFVVGAVDVKSGTHDLDVHGMVINIIFNDSGFFYWKTNEYDNYEASAINPSWEGASHVHQTFDMNEKLGILLSYRHVNGRTTMNAARYDVALNNWSSWRNNNWNALGTADAVPVANHPIDEEFRDYSVVNIKGTNRFLAVYRVYNSSLTSDSEMRAAIYDDNEKNWSVWNGSWQKASWEINQTPISGPVPWFSPMLSKNNKAYKFYLDRYGMHAIIYDDATSSWEFKNLTNNGDIFGNFALGIDSDNKIWLAYKNGSEIIYSVEENGNWNEWESLYKGVNPDVLEMNFLENIPIFFVEDQVNGKYRVFAISDTANYDFFDSKREIIPLPKPNKISSDKITQIRYFDNQAFANIWNGAGFCVYEDYYGSSPSGHMEIDKDGYLYSPRVQFESIGIFSQNFQQGQKNNFSWGGFWDYFSFPSSVSIYEKLGKVFITDLLVNGGAGSFTDSRLQIWNQTNRTNDIIWKSYGSYCRGAWVQTYFPEIIYGFKYAADSAVDEVNDLLYVTDSVNNRIQVFNLSSWVNNKPVKIKNIGTYGNNSKEFKFPQGIDVDLQGNVYVVDTNNHRIQKLDKDGNYILSWGSLGREVGDFRYPYAISVDQVKELVYVSDPYNKRIQVFNLTGGYVYSFGLDSYTLGNYYDNVLGIVAENNKLFVSKFDRMYEFDTTNLKSYPDNCIDDDRDGIYIGGLEDECGPLDCNDSEFYVSPNAYEIDEDGIDNNCDGIGYSSQLSSMSAVTGFWSKTISFLKSFFGLTGKSIDSITEDSFKIF